MSCISSPNILQFKPATRPYLGSVILEETLSKLVKVVSKVFPTVVTAAVKLETEESAVDVLELILFVTNCVSLTP